MDRYTSTIFNKEIDRLHLNISEICHAKLEKNRKYREKKPSFTRIYGIIDGEGVITSNGAEIPMTVGNIYILPTGVDMAYRCTSELEKIFFHVNLLQYNSYDMFRNMSGVTVIPNKAEEIEQALYLFSRYDMYAVMRLKAWLWDVISMGLEISGTDFDPINRYSPLVEQVISYVDSHLRSGLSVADIAADLFISESRLQKSFRQEMNQPLGKYISDRLYFTAEQELRTTDRSIKEISTELGFCDPFYFTRCFTQRYGTSPSEYRKRLK